MIVTKSTPVSCWTLSAYGWSSDEGSEVRMAVRTEGASAMERATAVVCRRADSSAWPRSLR